MCPAARYNIKNSVHKGACTMEEMRSFGYICPECGKPVIASRSVFALTAAAARMECACEKSTV